MIVTAKANPILVFTGAVLTVGGVTIDLSTLLTNNSLGVLTYSITGTAATLSGNILTPVSVGEVTVTAYVESANGFNAGSISAVFYRW